jgi:hypothetical protein
MKGKYSYKIETNNQLFPLTKYVSFAFGKVVVLLFRHGRRCHHCNLRCKSRLRPFNYIGPLLHDFDHFYTSLNAAIQLVGLYRFEVEVIRTPMQFLLYITFSN